MPLFQHEEWGRSVEETCAVCHLLPTKPGTQPIELAPWISAALDLDNLHEMGVSFSYPDALTPREWAALEALGLARSLARSKDRRDREKQRTNREKESHLKALVGRNQQ